MSCLCYLDTVVQPTYSQDPFEHLAEVARRFAGAMDQSRELVCLFYLIVPKQSSEREFESFLMEKGRVRLVADVSCDLVSW